MTLVGARFSFSLIAKWVLVLVSSFIDLDLGA